VSFNEYSLSQLSRVDYACCTRGDYACCTRYEYNDVLSKLREAGGPDHAETFCGDTDFDIDMIKAAQGGFAGGFFALWVHSPDTGI